MRVAKHFFIWKLQRSGNNNLPTELFDRDGLLRSAAVTAQAHSTPRNGVSEDEQGELFETFS
jgi:hypothetical protein